MLVVGCAVVGGSGGGDDVGVGGGGCSHVWSRVGGGVGGGTSRRFTQHRRSTAQPFV